MDDIVPTILLVEDNPAEAGLVIEALAAGPVPVTVRVAADGVAALALLRCAGRDTLTHPALVLLDLNLPRQNGHEALAEIRRDAALRRLPVVMLTTSDAEEDVYRAYDLGVNSYIVKPRTLPDLMRTISLIATYWLATVTLPPLERTPVHGK